jgi:hypothetical protein
MRHRVALILFGALASFLLWRYSVQRVMAVPDPAMLPPRSEDGQNRTREFIRELSKLNCDIGSAWGNAVRAPHDSNSFSRDQLDAISGTETVAARLIEIAQSGDFCMPAEWPATAPIFFGLIDLAHRQALAVHRDRTIGRSESAIENFLGSLEVAHQQRNGGLGIMGLSVGVAMDRIVVDEFTRDLPEWQRLLGPERLNEIDSALAKRAWAGYGIEAAVKNEYFFAINNAVPEPDTDYSNPFEPVFRQPPIADRLAFYFLNNRQETLEKIGTFYSGFLLRGHTIMPHHQEWYANSKSQFSYRHFSPLNVWGWNSTQSISNLAGFLATYYHGVARMRAALVAFRLSRGQSLESLPAEMLINPTTGTPWEIDIAAGTVSGSLPFFVDPDVTSPPDNISIRYF